jgi:hypothetical protein|tara:strand:+ start:1238 stop:1852 length:615 start_codon:yes stop_codon:yes gene_type:complete
MIKFVNEQEVLNCISSSRDGKNQKFLQQSHSLWFRFKNYTNNPPFALIKNNKIVSIIFATTSDKTKYINLYEICTIQGYEGKGYGTEIWQEFVSYWYNNNMKRIKLSCTPSSITWHLRNGLVFWSVDKQGSLRSDQPLKQNIEQQKKLRDESLNNSELIIPNKKVCDKLKLESLETTGLSQKKSLETYKAIQQVGKYWFRSYLF